MTDQPTTPIAKDGELTDEETINPLAPEEQGGPMEFGEETEDEEEDDEDETVDPEPEADDFFGDEDEVVLPNPDEVITIQTSSGGKFYVVSTEPIKVSEVIGKSGLNVLAGAEIYMNGSKITLDTLVPPAQTIMIVGTVKGGTK